MITSPRSAMLLVCVLTSLVVASGCGSGKTKAGVASPSTLALKMPAPDGDDPDAEFFADQVKRLTEGRVRIVIDGDTYTSVDPDNELRLVRDLRDGKVALAYVPARAWERDGIAGFRALQAPFLIDSYALLRRVTTGPVATQMLRNLDQAGLVGLGLVPKELRRPLGRHPLTSVAAFRGARIRVVSSPTSVLDLRALGAVPLTNFTSHEVLNALSAGKLDGVESETHSMEDNSYEEKAPYLSANVTLFAKAQTIVIRRDVLARLDAHDQAALRQAARATVAHADPASQEKTEVVSMCKLGLRIVRATPSELAELRRAAAAAYSTLERDRSTRQSITAIQRVKRTLPATSAALAACQKITQPAPVASAPFPQGRFESTITPEDFRRGGATVDPTFPTPWRITIEKGRWITNERPPFAGTYVLHGHDITFVIQRPDENSGNRETLTWSYYRGKLTFKVVAVADSGSRVIYTAHPWQRVGS